MYVDESGDCGLPSGGSPTTLFCLAGVVVHELAWQDTINQILQFRRWLKRKYGVFLEAELHTAEMISKTKKLHASLRSLNKHSRLAIIRNFADEIARMRDVNIISIVLDKSRGVATPEDVFNYAWCSLFQRFENTIDYKNFRGPFNPQERGIVFPDDTDGGKLKQLLARMRLSNRLAELPASGGLQALRTTVSVQGMTGLKDPFATFVQAQTRTESPGMVLRRIELGSKI